VCVCVCVCVVEGYILKNGIIHFNMTRLIIRKLAHYFSKSRFPCISSESNETASMYLSKL